MRNYGFDEIASNFIIGMPGDTWSDILTTFEFADKITNHEKVLDYSLFSIATPLPGTEMYENAKKMKVIPEDLKPEDFYGFGKGLLIQMNGLQLSFRLKELMSGIELIFLQADLIITKNCKNAWYHNR